MTSLYLCSSGGTHGNHQMIFNNNNNVMSEAVNILRVPIKSSLPPFLEIAFQLVSGTALLNH